MIAELDEIQRSGSQMSAPIAQSRNYGSQNETCSQYQRCADQPAWNFLFNVQIGSTKHHEEHAHESIGGNAQPYA